ncbi:MAG: ABC transporter ATP-binding protein [Xanthomonadales bacterium]|nr:ABC transporter ATP-binding protein [Xanthomonadales bacterium]
MLEVEGLAVRYGPVVAVDGIDLRIDSGCVALLGPNGAGKTSTLRALSGLEPSTGSIVFEGRDITAISAERIARAGMVHVPEGRRLFASLTVHENLLVGLTAATGREALFTVDEVYDLFPALAPLQQRAAWSLSGGEQQMVAVGRAMLAAPRLLMLDEPSLGLAPIVVRAVYQALQTIKDTVPILLVEQNTIAALELASRAAVIVNGQIVLEGGSDEIGDREDLLNSYLGNTEPAT